MTVPADACRASSAATSHTWASSSTVTLIRSAVATWARSAATAARFGEQRRRFVAHVGTRSTRPAIRAVASPSVHPYRRVDVPQRRFGHSAELLSAVARLPRSRPNDLSAIDIEESVR